ncbi:hypothetical protein [Streptomyces sp. PTY087I2]|uniref:hypothetical protein n=1 Tax=Streptomyces sp. PTY087I2 TaxID=1819298 RepID=UPI00080B96E9|nr:hypothetical protein [Streptomyces sp. PTY087I2]OCC14096.1 hypothetical protein A3Q37_00370 [Streptomyces sp. PTY087I2]
MSTSDQDQDQRRDVDVPIADTDTATGAAAKTEADADPEVESDADAEAQAQAQAEGDALGASGGQDEKRLTPRQARRLRIVLSSLGMAAMAVVLALRIASRSSVLVVGVYGLALILCGVMIELSRNGRTRLASWLLGAGLLAAVGTDWLLLP